MGFGLNLESFIEKYIEITAELVKNEILLESYYKSLKKEFSKRFNISEQEITYIHHSFHWAFFCDKNGSPFGYSPHNKDGEFRVRLIKEVSLEEKLRLKKYILDNYRGYLLERIKMIENHNLNQ